MAFLFSPVGAKMAFSEVNFSSTYLEVLSGNWSPALQIRTILLSIQALLGAPNPDDPLANDVAQRWKEDEPGAIATGV